MSCFSFGPQKGEKVGEQQEVTWSGAEQNTKPSPRDTKVGRVRRASYKLGSVQLCAFETPGDALQLLASPVLADLIESFHSSR